MFRDKMYLELDNGWLCNVTGYQHPSNHAFASLKYVDGQKWTQGYDAACAFLRTHDPQLLQFDYICIPQSRIAKIYEPQSRWHEIQNAQPASGLLAETVQLVTAIAEITGVAAEHFGVTDSLLWSNGHPASDIDLVVVGRENYTRLQSKLAMLFESPEFQRPDPNVMTAPYGLDIENWARILARKLQMGVFRDRLFSVRGMLGADEVPRTPFTPLSGDSILEQLKFQIADTTDSLLFPAIYRNAKAEELVDYSVVYEGAFRVGESVSATCALEHAPTGKRRWVICGAAEF